MSQADLAEKAGLSREYIARLETGHHDPSLSVLVKLAKALKVKLAELLE
jgi:transcriptional regulator with XRE-family HTH domain